MISAIKAELRKLFSIRATYVILALALAFEIFFAFYATGYKATPSDLHNPALLAQQVTAAVGLLSILIALVGVLLVTQEYRYNTILYSLTSAPRRSRVFLAKLLVISAFSITLTFIMGGLSPLLTLAGTHLAGHSVAAQVFPFGSLALRNIFVGWGFSMLAFILAVGIRAQIGAIVALFLMPGTVEPIVGLLIHKNQVYLPFSSLDAVRSPGVISYSHAAAVAVAYIVVGLLVVWQFFVRRDAN